MGDSLRVREARFRAIWAATNDAMALSDADGIVIEANPAYFELYGYTADEVIGQPFAVIFPPERRAWAETEYQAAFHFGPPEAHFETTVVRRDGSQRLVEARVRFLEEAGRRVAMLSIIRDLTEHQRAAEQLRASQAWLQTSLAEKEMLLKEVHHRVKNNLQVIISLLRLQSQHLSDPAIREQFRDTQNRVYAMALIHEKLYGGSDLLHIAFGPYAQSLAVSVFRSYLLPSDKIGLTVEVDERISLSIDVALPLGIILTELVSNSLKYAFPDGRSGMITVQAQQAADLLGLTVRDDGVGLPAGLASSQSTSLGLQLVQRLVRQLDGTLQVEEGQGACFQLLIPLVSQQ